MTTSVDINTELANPKTAKTAKITKSVDLSTEPKSARPSKMLRPIGKDETFSAVTEYRGDKKVYAKFAIRKDDKSPRYEKEAMFDFSGVTEEDLHILAMYAAKVRVQALLRACGDEEFLNADNLSMVDVYLDVVKPERRSADPTANAVRAIMKATGLSERAARDALAGMVSQK